MKALASGEGCRTPRRRTTRWPLLDNFLRAVDGHPRDGDYHLKHQQGLRSGGPVTTTRRLAVLPFVAVLLTAGCGGNLEQPR